MKKIALLSVGVFTLILQNASAQSLFTTSNDFSGFTSGANFTIAPVTTSLDSSSVNGIGNTSAPGAAGTSGALQLNWISGSFVNNIFSQGEQGNTTFLSALENASTLTFQYTTPTTSGGTFFQLGVVLNYNSHFVQQGWDSTTGPDVNGVSTATINWAADGLGAAIAAQAAGGGITFFQFGILYNSNFTPTSSFAVDNFQAVQPVPEPATMALLGVGGLSLLKFARRRF